MNIKNISAFIFAAIFVPLSFLYAYSVKDLSFEDVVLSERDFITITEYLQG